VILKKRNGQQSCVYILMCSSPTVLERLYRCVWCSVMRVVLREERVTYILAIKSTHSFTCVWIRVSGSQPTSGEYVSAVVSRPPACKEERPSSCWNI